MPSRIENFYREAVRRRLVQTAALYVAVAWGGTEILVFLGDALFGESVAGDARRYLAILLIAGFPAAMYLAWTRDLGLKARRWFSAGVLAVLVVAVLVATVPEPSDVVIEGVAENTLAVLPFDVCEERVSDRPFAGGLTREVFERLAQRDRLKVRGHTSVQTVLKSSPSDVTTAGLLGVKYLVKGIVCRNGLDLTLHAELVDEKGFVVWQDQYTQGVNDADQVEQQLSALVDNGVASRLGDVEIVSSDLAVDRRAHEQLIIGYGYLDENDVENARTAYEKALEYQPEYAEAIYALSWVVENREEVRPMLRRALRVARSALERNPHDYKAMLTAARAEFRLGFIADNLFREVEDISDEEALAGRAAAQAHYAEAERMARSVLAANSAETDTRLMLARAINFQGANRRKESLQLLQEGTDKEPFNMELTARLAFRLAEFGRVREAMDLIDQFNVLPQGKRFLWSAQFEILQTFGFDYVGRIDEKLAYHIDLLKSGHEFMGKENAVYQLWWTVADLAWLGLYNEAAELHAVVEDIHPEGTDANSWTRQNFLEDWYAYATGQDVSRADSDSWRDGCDDKTDMEILQTWSLLSINCAFEFWSEGDKERGLKLMRALHYGRSGLTLWAEREFETPMSLAQMYLAMGMEEDAKSVYRYIAKQLEPQVAAGVRHPDTLGFLAEARYRIGDQQGALDTLSLSIDYGAYHMVFCCRDYLTQAVLKHWKEEAERRGYAFEFWAEELAGNPDVELARSRMRAIVENQRSNILALLEQNDMEELLAPLIEGSRETS